MNKTSRPRPCCSPECVAWLRWARRVASWDPGPAAEAEARELLEIARALDQRLAPDEFVPGFSVEINWSWVYDTSPV